MQLAIFDLDHTLLPFDSDKGWNQFIDVELSTRPIITKTTNGSIKTTSMNASTSVPTSGSHVSSAKTQLTK